MTQCQPHLDCPIHLVTFLQQWWCSHEQIAEEAATSILDVALVWMDGIIC